MGKYLASQIIRGAMTYEQAVATKWGKKFKAVIDKTLDERGYMIDADGNCVKKPVEEKPAEESSSDSSSKPEEKASEPSPPEGNK